MVTLQPPGIYSYARAHSLAARKQNRGQITPDELKQIKAEDSKVFIDEEGELGCTYVSDGQFLWKDLARPFAGSAPEVSLEMVRRADTNTFLRRPKINSPSDVQPVDLSQFLLHQVENQQVSLVGPYSYAQLVDIPETVSRADFIAAYAKAAAESLKPLKEKGLAHVLLSEFIISEKPPSSDEWALEKEALTTLKNALSDVELSLGVFYYNAKPVWDQLLELPVDAITVDLRSRDYFNPIPQAEQLIENHSSFFESDTNKRITLGCVNGRNGGFTEDKGLESAEWIADVVRLASKKTNAPLGLAFSTDETIIPRQLASAKFKNLGAAKKKLAEEGL